MVPIIPPMSSPNIHSQPMTTMSTTIPPMASECTTSTPAPRARKWDSEITKARQSEAWLAFEADLHQSAALRSRVARALDRFGLGTSDIVVDEALDYLLHKELGASARYFNQTGKAQFNQQQLTHAVLSFMVGKEAQRHLTDLTLHEHEGEYSAEQGDHLRPSEVPDPTQLTPDEYAARCDAARIIRRMIPDGSLELFDLWLAARGDGRRGELGTVRGLCAYAQRQGIGLSTVYWRMEQLAREVQQHPWFEELTRPFRSERQSHEDDMDTRNGSRRGVARARRLRAVGSPLRRGA
jgi:hypothetical protein